MHNNIMGAGSRDRPPMLAMGRYAQWKSCFMRYVDTKPNSVALKKCILQGPYVLSEITIPGQPATDDSPANYKVIHLIFTRIGDDIYLTFDACTIAKDMWIAIERLQQGESLNKKDVKTNLFWEFSRFTSRDGEYIKYKGKEIAKPITPPSESASEEDSDPKQAQRDKDIQKNLALIAKYFKKIYQPTNNNLRTSLNTRNKNVDTYLRYKNENQTGQFGNQRTVTIARARETVGNQVQSDAEYNVFANERQHSEQPESINDTYVVEKDDSNVIVNTKECHSDVLA
ncbi:hypothetical protein Tco_1265512 [Tanacetum coccineum]